MITKEEFLKNRSFYIDEMKKGKIFIYPTDTVLWIGTIISNHSGIDKIFELKKRENKPLLIIIPWLDWVEENCIVSEDNLKIMKEKLPWAYSFVLKLKDKNSIYSKINNYSWSIWVRIPWNWFSQVIKELWEPFITTSVNLSWESSVIDSVDIPKEISEEVDYIIESDEKFTWTSSTLIDIRWDEIKIIRK